ncbi:MAG: acetyl-CoA carboxylase carboxyltransferase subunit alpha [Candidatus Omnitrophica bacterium]|nr:acetyl-CoA carboxylase carboxyltransferase subunit alpha [Candidatus Omnitrophota bacterium]
MQATPLDFEKPVVELEARIQEMKKLSAGGKVSLQPEIAALEEKLAQLRHELYSGLTPWQRVQLARHPQRPYTLDYIRATMTDFVELHGDRLYGDDKALIGGMAKLDGRPVMVLGHQKGRDTKENLMRNFGSAHPEGYRKALRLMRLAAKFHLPLLIFIDTPGAYPGIGAEERGQAHSIAYNLREMVQVAVPILCMVIGEGGSGGALGIGIGDRICVLENAYYSVISPEGCAAILWKDRKRAPEAAAALQMTAKDLLRLGLIDEIIEEPLGGAHRDPELLARRLKETMLRFLQEMAAMTPEALLRRRYDRFRKIGVYEEQRPLEPTA